MDQDDRVIWRAAIWCFMDAGADKHQVKSTYGLSLPRSTLEGYISAYQPGWRTNGIPFDAPRSGRPESLSPRKKRKVVEELKHGAHSREVADSFGISQPTVLHYAHAEHLVARVPRLRTFLSDEQIAKRLAFAKKVKKDKNEPWKQVLFSDESAVILSRTDPQAVWVEEGQDPEELTKFAFPKSVWVWAGISWEGATPLIFLTWEKGGGFKALNYQDQVLKKMHSFLKKPDGGQLMLMEDGSRCHTAKINKPYREAHGIKSFPSVPESWPPNSPDLNPIENLWGEMKHHLHTLKPYPQDVISMTKSLKFFWKTVTQEKCQRFIGNYKDRLEAVIEAKGHTTKY